VRAGKHYNGTIEVGFDACVEGETGKKRTLRRKTVEEITNKVFEITTLATEREIWELKIKMKELTKAGGLTRGAQGQGVRWSD